MSTKDVNFRGNNIPIQEFDLNMMCENPAICMIAKRGSGKSWVCRAIIKHFNHLPGGVIIAPTDKMNSFYGKFFPDIYIHYKYDSRIVENILSRQEMMIEKCKKYLKEGKKVDPRAFLIMDDCLSSKGAWVNEQPIMEIFFNGRHFHLMYILTMQFPLGIKPELRGNFDYIFLLAEDFISNQKRIYDHYAGMFPSFETFRQVFTQLTDDFGCMVIVNRGPRKNLMEKLFYFKAENEGIEKIGCKQFTDFHDRNYDQYWKTRRTKFDMNKFITTKNKPRLVVEKVEN